MVGERERWDVFIAHAGADAEHARELYDRLDHGRCRVFVDFERVELGQFWDDAIDGALAASRIVAAIVTEDSVGAHYVREEVASAIQYVRERQGTHRLIPIYVGCRPGEDVRPLYGTRRIHSAFVEDEADWDRVAEQILRLIDVRPRVPRRVSVAALPHTSDTFVGRQAELELLDEAWEDPGTHVVSLVAWGGVGKTSLATRWVHEKARDGFGGAEAVFAWSFYSQGAREDAQVSADRFVDHALQFFGDPEPEAGSPFQKAERLAELARGQRTLLVFDGLEPMQHPRSAPEVGGRLRDPALATLLKELAGRIDGLCLVTTRLPVADLDPSNGTTLRRRELAHLGEATGAALLAERGVDGSDGDLRAASREFGGHALALHLLAGLLATYCDGDVRRRDTVGPLLVDEDLGGHARRVLRAHEERLDPAHVAALRLVGLFDRPADAEALAAVRADPPIAGLTARPIPWWARWFKRPQPWFASGADWTRAVKHLADLGLVRREDEGSLDAHPLVREHAAERLRAEHAEAWREANDRLFEHFRARPDEEHPDTLDEMEPLFRAIAHGCAAGRHLEALREVYWRRVQRGNDAYLTDQLGSFGSDLAALAHLFREPWETPEPSLPEHLQAVLLSWAGFALRALGRLAEAVEPMEAGLRMCVARQQWPNAAIDAGNLAELLATLGRLAEAEARAREAVEHADRSGDDFQRLAKRTTLADVLHQQGRLDAARELFAQAERLQAERQPRYAYLYSVQGYQYCDLHLTRGEPAEARRRAERFFDWRVPSDSLLDIGLDHLTLGRAAHALGDLDAAAPSLDQAVDGLRTAGQQQELPRGLLARAALRRDLDDHDEARKDLHEVHTIAERSGMRLFLADHALESARLALATADCDAAAEHYATARELVQATGYHRRDPELAELAGLLDEG
ncbi:MAG: TIR domain-containing protein [Myxococcota bacterium]